MEEIWKDVKDFEGRYQISNLGKLLNVKKHRLIGGSYNNVTLYDEQGRAVTKSKIHIMAEAFLEKPKDGKFMFAVLVDKNQPLTSDNIAWVYCNDNKGQGRLHTHLSHDKKMINNIKAMFANEEMVEFQKVIIETVEKYRLFKEKEDRLKEINNLEERLAKLKEEFRNDYK